MFNYPKPLNRLINEISKLPGIGPKMAERISLYLLKKRGEYVDALAGVLTGIKTIGFCKICFNVTDKDICSVCEDSTRGKDIICVVEGPEDVITVERTEKFGGYYHVLHGLINPLNDVMPDNLRIRELVDRLKKQPEVKELILAINHTVEGDATALYIKQALEEAGLKFKLTRLAKGLPTGSDIRYADEMTSGRQYWKEKKCRMKN